MKKTVLILSLLMTVAFVGAQGDYGKFAYGFGASGGMAGNTSFVLGLPFYSQSENAGSYSVAEGIMQAQLIRVDMELAGCQNDSAAVSPAHVKDTTGFFLDYPGENIVFRGRTINVFPAGYYDSTAYNAGHYNWNAQYNYDSLTTLVLDVWPIYELFDTLYLDSTEIVTDYAHNVLMIPAMITQPLHGGPNEYVLGTVDHDCDSVRHFFVNLCGGTVKDADGNGYESVFVGMPPMRYCWTKPNMQTTTYVGGGSVPNMVYTGYGHEDVAENLALYGRLYNWYAAVNLPEGSNATPPTTANGGFVTGLCPKGWHIPDSANIVGISSIDAWDLMADTLWINPGHDTGAGFYALPAGLYMESAHRCENLLGMTYFWSCVRHSFSDGWVCSLAFGCNRLLTDEMSVENGASVRCVKNQIFDADGNELND